MPDPDSSLARPHGPLVGARTCSRSTSTWSPCANLERDARRAGLHGDRPAPRRGPPGVPTSASLRSWSPTGSDRPSTCPGGRPRRGGRGLRRSVGFGAGMPLIGARPARRQPDGTRSCPRCERRTPTGCWPGSTGRTEPRRPRRERGDGGGLEVLGSPVPPRHDDHSTGANVRLHALSTVASRTRAGRRGGGDRRGAPSRPRRGGTPRRALDERTGAAALLPHRHAALRAPLAAVTTSTG